MSPENEDTIMKAFWICFAGFSSPHTLATSVRVKKPRSLVRHLLKFWLLVAVLAGQASCTSTSSAPTVFPTTTQTSVYYHLDVTVNITGNRRNESEIIAWLEEVFQNDLDKCRPGENRTMSNNTTQFSTTTTTAPTTEVSTTTTTAPTTEVSTTTTTAPTTEVSTTTTTAPTTEVSTTTTTAPTTEVSTTTTTAPTTEVSTTTTTAPTTEVSTTTTTAPTTEVSTTTTTAPTTEVNTTTTTAPTTEVSTTTTTAPTTEVSTTTTTAPTTEVNTTTTTAPTTEVSTTTTTAPTTEVSTTTTTAPTTEVNTTTTTALTAEVGTTTTTAPTTEVSTTTTTAPTTEVNTTTTTAPTTEVSTTTTTAPTTEVNTTTTTAPTTEVNTTTTTALTAEVGTTTTTAPTTEVSTTTTTALTAEVGTTTTTAPTTEVSTTTTTAPTTEVNTTTTTAPTTEVSTTTTTAPTTEVSTTTTTAPTTEVSTTTTTAPTTDVSTTTTTAPTTEVSTTTTTAPTTEVSTTTTTAPTTEVSTTTTTAPTTEVRTTTTTAPTTEVSTTTTTAPTTDVSTTTTTAPTTEVSTTTTTAPTTEVSTTTTAAPTTEVSTTTTTAPTTEVSTTTTTATTQGSSTTSQSNNITAAMALQSNSTTAPIDAVTLQNTTKTPTAGTTVQSQTMTPSPPATSPPATSPPAPSPPATSPPAPSPPATSPPAPSPPAPSPPATSPPATSPPAPSPPAPSPPATSQNQPAASPQGPGSTPQVPLTLQGQTTVGPVATLQTEIPQADVGEQSPPSGSRRKRREIGDNITQRSGTFSSGLFQGVDVSCSVKTEIRDSECVVILQVKQPLSPCCILQTLCAASQNSSGISVVGRRVDRANLIENGCSGNPEDASGCVYSGPTGKMCDAPDSRYDERNSSHCRPENCSCSAYCSGTDAYYTFNLEIKDPMVNFSHVSSLIDMIELKPFSQNFSVSCGNTSTDLQNCSVILGFAQMLPICHVATAVMNTFGSEEQIVFDGVVIRAAICGHLGIDGNLLQSEFTWVNSDLKPGNFCQPMQQSNNITCQNGKNVIVLLEEQCDANNLSATSTTMTPIVSSSSFSTTTPQPNMTLTSTFTVTETPFNTTTTKPQQNTTEPINTTTTTVTETTFNTTTPEPTTTEPINTTTTTVTETTFNTTTTTPEPSTTEPINTTTTTVTETTFNTTTPEPTTTEPINTTTTPVTETTFNSTTVQQNITSVINTTMTPIVSVSTLSPTSPPPIIPTKATTTTPAPTPKNTPTTVGPATTQSAEFMAGRLLAMAGNVSSLNSSQVAQLVEELKNLVSEPNISVSLGNISVNIVSRLLNGSPEVLANSAQRIIQVVDLVGLNLNLDENGEEVNLEAENLVLSVEPAVGTAFEGADFQFPDPSQDSRGLRRRRNVRVDSSLPQGSVTLPASLTQGLSPEEQELVSRVQFNFYQNSTVFQDPSLNTQRRLNSGILGASVGNQSISGLQEFVMITLRHLEPVPANFVATCVFWNFSLNGRSGGWSSAGCHVRSSTDDQTVCACDHLTSFGILLNLSREPIISRLQATILTFITYIGCGVSAIFLSVTLLTYLLFGKLRKNTPSKIHMQLCAALLLLNLVFLVDAWLALYPNAVGLCISTAWFLHYFLLASFTWMGLEAVHMYQALVKVFNSHVPFYMLRLAAVGWGLPMIVVIIVIAIDKDNYGLVAYGRFIDGSSDDFCWLRNDIAFYVAVVAYFCVVFLFNFAMFIVVLVQLFRIRKHNPHNNQHRTTGKDVSSVVGITVLLGLTWGFAFFAWGPVNLAFMYLFAIFNSLQGFFIFLFYCALKENVRKQWRTYLCCGSLRLAENSGWSHTHTARRSSQTNLASGSSTNVINSSSSFFNSSASQPTDGIGNPADDRVITGEEEPLPDVAHSGTNTARHRNRQAS